MSCEYSVKAEESAYEKFIDLMENDNEFSDLVKYNLCDSNVFCPLKENDLIRAFQTVWNWDAEYVYGDVVGAFLNYIDRMKEECDY